MNAKFSVQSVKQISPEFWLVTLALTEEGKTPLTRDFVITEQQLAFLEAATRSLVKS